MLARIRSAAVLGVDAYGVDVEIDISNGLPSFSTVGLPQGAVREGSQRVAAALANAGFAMPLRVTINGQEKVITPTETKQTLQFPEEIKTFEVNRNFYIEAEKSDL